MKTHSYSIPDGPPPAPGAAETAVAATARRPLRAALGTMRRAWSGANRREARICLLFAAIFLAVYLVPFESPRVQGALGEAFAMLQEYAREHVLLCLVPAFFIAGAISTFISKGRIMAYLGPRAPKAVAYGVAATAGSVLAVCSCTVLPMFAGIYANGAGIGPASAFLYSGPAINVLAVILTTRVLGLGLGLARGLGAVLFAVVIGLLMHAVFRKEERSRVAAAADFGGEAAPGSRSLGKTAAVLGTMIAGLVFLNWAPGASGMGLWAAVFRIKWVLAGASLALLLWMLRAWFDRAEIQEWLSATWIFAKQIFPLLLAGVFVAGLLLGRPGHDGLIPGGWIAGLVGGNGIAANLFAAVSGALMYFATLTEIPILQGLLGSGMGQGPALTLLLAGPPLSLPSMLVIRSIFGTRKTLVYVGLVVALSALTGFIYGALAG